MFYSLLCVTARAANSVLVLMGQHTEVSAITIRSPRFAVSIQRGCDALEPAWFFCAAVLAYPGYWSRKAAGLAVGVITIFGLNMLRIVSLFFVGAYMPSFFPMAHLEIWPMILVVATLLLWVAWIHGARRDGPRDHEAA